MRRSALVLSLVAAMAGIVATGASGEAGRPPTKLERANLVSAAHDYLRTHICCAGIRGFHVREIGVSTVDTHWALVDVDLSSNAWSLLLHHNKGLNHDGWAVRAHDTFYNRDRGLGHLGCAVPPKVRRNLSLHC